ncbi:hypothetical protein ACFL29_02165, partial [Patescibacteria group bacterium]
SQPQAQQPPAQSQAQPQGEPQQKSIEQFFADYGVVDPDKKMKILPELTDIVYDRNMHVVWYEKSDDEEKKKQYVDGLNELEQRIKEIFEENK